MMTRTSRFAATLLIAAAAALAGGDAFAQAYPAKPIRILTPYPPGSGSDVLLRSIGQEITIAWGQAIVIENRPGASTIIAADACAHAAPDGYTLCMLDRGTFSLVPHLINQVPYTAADFQPITMLAYTISVVAASPELPAKNFNEFVALAKAKPGRLNYATVGDGTPPHLVMEWLKKKLSLDIVHVPMKSPPDVIRSIATNETQVTYFGLINFLAPIKAGQAKGLAVSGAARSPLLPEVPTLAEAAGMTELDPRLWFALYAPAKVPVDLVQKWYREVARIISAPAFREQRLVQQGWEPVSAMSPEELGKMMVADRVGGAALVGMAGDAAK
jgi:tripartite-type tricarboxylate transporter receptor subunit TctC